MIRRRARGLRGAWCGGVMLALATPGVPLMAQLPVYRDPGRSFQQRALDLVARMTLQEKVAQMQNNAPAIPRLGVPAYDWWNEALHGVARAGAATVFPQAIGLAASFDTALLGQVATAISDEARAKHNRFAALGLHRRYQGLTFWSPNVNIFRDPRWGRGQETYGEDPYLTARLGVAFVRGLQGEGAPGDGTYRKLDATAKHFAVHSGPEATRHQFDAHPGERDLYETYLPAFQALVQEGHADAVMAAYNRLNGEPAAASARLLQDILRGAWGFEGYVVSDCDAVDDIFVRHKVVATAAQAAALAVRNGDDLNCGSTYRELPEALRQGLVSEAQINQALTRLMRARLRLGMFDPPARVPWARIAYSVNQSPQHDALARRAAQESIVLLKNEGVLPLSKHLHRIAVIGPTADDTLALLGNYYGTPARPVTILQGIRAAVPHAEVVYVRGADLVENRTDAASAPLIEPRYLRPSAGSGAPGLTGEYFRGGDFNATPVMTRVDARVAFQWDERAPTDDAVASGELPRARAIEGGPFAVRWSGQLLAPVSGRYQLDLVADHGARLWLDGRLLLDRLAAPRARAHSVSVELAAGRAYPLRLECQADVRDSQVRLGWRIPAAQPPLRQALAAARAAEAVIFVGGLSGDVEGEEMPVSYPGFAGGDRTDLRLPKPQAELLEALRATGKPVVLVLTAGSALAIDWAQQQLPAILLAWYPGQRGGDAVADVLFGAADPGGRLPVTFYRAQEQLPAFDDYSMRGRTYRYFEGQPLYAFGYGLSYTRFVYSGLHLDHVRLGLEGRLRVTLQVRNAGARAGDEVVQLYARALRPPRTHALKELRGFQRLSLQPGEARQVSFTLAPRADLRIYDEQRRSYAVDPGEYEVQIGASSADVRLAQRFVVTTDP